MPAFSIPIFSTDKVEKNRKTTSSLFLAARNVSDPSILIKLEVPVTVVKAANSPVGETRMLSFHLMIGEETLWAQTVNVDISNYTSSLGTGTAPLVGDVQLLNNVSKHDGVGNEG